MENVKCCFFHLYQSIYRHIQAEGLQNQYRDSRDRSMKIAAHMICALAFVPLEYLDDTFEESRPEIPEKLASICDITSCQIT